jgi:GNAT superfamily N-acetyltransferase
VEFVIERVRYDAPEVAGLVASLQQHYVELYGSQDADPTPAEAFRPPGGMFLLGRLAGVPVAMGGYRRRADGAAEIKRMYVAASARGQGLARRMLAALEAEARAAGFARMVLNTGYRQVDAIALYESSGYRPIAAFGHYADVAGARFYGKALEQNDPSGTDGSFALGKVSG